MMNKSPASLDHLRDAAAKRIHELSQQWAENTIALGSEFKRVRDTFPAAGQDDGVGAPTSSGDHSKRPGWHDWVKANTTWSHQQVSSFIRVAEKFGGRSLPANVSHSLLEFLARDHVPEQAREEVLARIEAGEKLGRAQAQEMVGGKRSAPKGARPVIIGWIEMESWRLQTITETQSNTIASERQEIAQIASASLLLSYRENPDSLAEIKAATDANSK
jgi:hypothetical protein